MDRPDLQPRRTLCSVGSECLCELRREFAHRDGPIIKFLQRLSRAETVFLQQVSEGDQLRDAKPHLQPDADDESLKWRTALAEI